MHIQGRIFQTNLNIIVRTLINVDLGSTSHSYPYLYSVMIIHSNQMCCARLQFQLFNSILPPGDYRKTIVSGCMKHQGIWFKEILRSFKFLRWGCIMPVLGCDPMRSFVKTSFPRFRQLLCHTFIEIEVIVGNKTTAMVKDNLTE